jgi:hypothetical protein
VYLYLGFDVDGRLEQSLVVSIPTILYIGLKQSQLKGTCALDSKLKSSTAILEFVLNL